MMKEPLFSNLFSWLCFFWVAVLCTTGNPSPTLISGEKRISLQCLHNYMLLDMDLQDIPGLEPASLHLRHFSCKPYQVLDTRAIFRVPFQGCGTTRESNSDYIVYENVVDNSKESNTTRVLIRHAQELRYPFSCRYRQKYFLILQEGQSGKRRENEIDRGNGNSTKEKVFPEEVKRPTSSVSHVLPQIYLGIFLFGMHLLFSSWWSLQWAWDSSAEVDNLSSIFQILRKRIEKL